MGVKARRAGRGIPRPSSLAVAASGRDAGSEGASRSAGGEAALDMKLVGGCAAGGHEKETCRPEQPSNGYHHFHHVLCWHTKYSCFASEGLTIDDKFR
jgi:hypothetical protein